MILIKLKNCRLPLFENFIFKHKDKSLFSAIPTFCAVTMDFLCRNMGFLLFS